MAQHSSILLRIPPVVDTFYLTKMLWNEPVECKECWLYECWK